MNFRPLRWLPVALAVVSCAAPPPVEYPDFEVDVPDRWTATQQDPTERVAGVEEVDELTGDLASEAVEDVEPARPWWEEFGDDGLSAAVTEALVENRDLRALTVRILGAEAQSRIAGADRWPQVGFSADARRARQNFVGLPIPGGDVLTSRSNSFGLGFDLSWELDVWGRLRARTAAAMADVQAVQADWYGARLSLAGRVARSWFALVEVRRQIDLASSTLESFRATAGQVRERYKSGLRPSLDVRLAETNVAVAEATLEERGEQEDFLLRQIEVFLGRYPAAQLAGAENLPSVPGPVPVGLPATLVGRRPDLAAAERRLAASGARVKEAWRSLYPRISLTASAGTSSNQLGDLVDGDFGVWSLGANLLQPIFQGGRLIAGIDLAEAAQKEAAYSFVQSALVAFAEVESALAAERFLARRQAALERAVEQSVSARDLAQARYRRGLDDFITVREAQRSAFNNESQLLFVRRLRLEARVDLHLALGGGFRVAGDEPSETKGELPPAPPET